MLILIYDGSWPGFLTAVFEVYERKPDQTLIITSDYYQSDIFSDALEVCTDKVKSERVWLGLQKKLSINALQNIYSGYLSGLPGIENHLLAFIQLGIKTEAAEYAYADPSVLKVSQVSKMVHREKHRMEAFIRFKLTKDEIYYAVIEPDFNVIPLIISHFKKRYADQRWLIYDVKRNYGIYYNLETVEEILLEFNNEENSESESIFSPLENEYQSLWRDYFKHITIAERKNTKLHIRHVPKRYWKYLTEKAL